MDSFFPSYFLFTFFFEGHYKWGNFYLFVQGILLSIPMKTFFSSGFLLIIPRGFFIILFHLTMALASRHKKVKKKGTVTELKLVETISRSGCDTWKLEEVNTPRGKTSLTNARVHSSSPSNRPKLDPFDSEYTAYDSNIGADAQEKCHTLVFNLIS